MQFDTGTFMGALQLLKDDRSRGFRCDIETESTIAADQEAQQKARTEMLQAVGAFLQSALPMMQAMPAMLPLMGKMLLFLIRSFNAGVELESSFEDALEKLEQNPGGAMQNANAGQDAAKQAELQGKMALQQQDMQQDAQKHQFDMQALGVKVQADQVKAAAEIQRAQLQEKAELAEHAHAQERMRLEASLMPQGQPLAPQKLPFGAGPAMTGQHK